MPKTGARVTITALDGIPAVRPGDDIAGILIAAIGSAGLVPEPKDILVVAQKIVSKAEGRYLDLGSLDASPRALELAAVTRKDPRLIEAILSQSAAVVRARPGVLIVETRQGFIMANAGIDQSNLEPASGGTRVLLLPEDPDRSAQRIKERIDASFSTEIGVVVSDSIGRAWRLGTVGTALGAAGVPSLFDRRGELDLWGRRLEATEVGFADAVAAAAVLVMGEAAEGRPAALVRGLAWSAAARPAAALMRPESEDLFR